MILHIEVLFCQEKVMVIATLVIMMIIVSSIRCQNTTQIL